MYGALLFQSIEYVLKILIPYKYCDLFRCEWKINREREGAPKGELFHKDYDHSTHSLSYKPYHHDVSKNALFTTDWDLIKTYIVLWWKIWKKKKFLMALFHIGVLYGKTFTQFWKAFERSKSKNLGIFPHIIFQNILNLPRKGGKINFETLSHPKRDLLKKLG